MADITRTKLLIGATGWTKPWQQLLNTIGGPMDINGHYRYAAAMLSLGAEGHLDIYEKDGDIIAIAPIFKSKLYKLLTFHQIYGGPIFKSDIHPDDMAYVFKDLKIYRKNWRWQFMRLRPDLTDTPENHNLIHKAGYGQIMTGYSTATLDLTQTEDDLRAGLNGKWRNQLKKAESNEFDISHSFDKADKYQWLLEKETEAAKTNDYQTTPSIFVHQYGQMAKFLDGKDAKSILFVQAHRRREKLSGALFLLHGNTATYHVGWTGEEGRDANAQNQTLWESMMILKQNGIKYLDMGGVDTESMADVARFKLGTGAVPKTLVGTYA